VVRTSVRPHESMRIALDILFTQNKLKTHLRLSIFPGL
jgi:hypothetical protein